MHTCMYACRYVHNWLVRMYVHMYVCMYVHMYAHVINSQSVDAFKNNLDDYWRVTGYGHNKGPMAY